MLTLTADAILGRMARPVDMALARPAEVAVEDACPAPAARMVEVPLAVAKLAAVAVDVADAVALPDADAIFDAVDVEAAFAAEVAVALNADTAELVARTLETAEPVADPAARACAAPLALTDATPPPAAVDAAWLEPVAAATPVPVLVPVPTAPPRLIA